MKLIIEKSALLDALSNVQGVVERRNTIPILSNVKLEAVNNNLNLTATDMDILVQDTTECQVEEGGNTTVPVHTLYEIVRKLPDGGTIELALERNGEGNADNLLIKSAKSKFSLPTLPADEFPSIAEGDVNCSFTMKASDYSHLISRTRYAISNDDTRYYLNGVFMHKANDNGEEGLTAAATDGFRLAKAQVKVEESLANMPDVIVPKKAIYESKKIIGEDEDSVITIGFSDTKIKITYKNIVLISKLIDGNYPDYGQIIPKDNNLILEAARKDLADSIDRVATLSLDNDRSINFEVANNELIISADTSGTGKAEETVAVKYDGDDFKTSFNAKYLMEILGEFEDESVQFLFSDAKMPVIIRDSSNINSVYVVMPLRA